MQVEDSVELIPTYSRAVFGRCPLKIRLRYVRFTEEEACKFELGREDLGQASHEAAIKFDRDKSGQKQQGFVAGQKKSLQNVV